MTGPTSTVRVYRITHQRYAEDPYSGKGGLVASGRWHRRGRLVTYAAASLALATLEQLGRVNVLERLKQMVYAPAELDTAAIWTPPEDELPAGWDQRPPGAASQAYGEQWLARAHSVALRVPSVILPEGYNYVINPAHPDFEEALHVYEARPLHLDPRITERFEVNS